MSGGMTNAKNVCETPPTSPLSKPNAGTYNNVIRLALKEDKHTEVFNLLRQMKSENIEPDIAMFGKALGNGYAISAIIGEQEVMEKAQLSFISSTFWTERIGPNAALKTL